MVLLAKDLRFQEATQDNMAERSKAVAQGAIPQGRGFEPHRRQSSALQPQGFPLSNSVSFIPK